MKKSFIYLACALIAILMVLTCGLSFFAVQLQQKDPDSISTSVAQTVVAFNQQYQPTLLSNADLIATAVAQTVVVLNQQFQACAAATPTSTPTPYQYVAVTPTATPYPCNSSANMVSETYPDHTHLDPNQYFNKSWRLKNVGTCTWSTGYRLAFYSGNSMSAPSYVNMPYAVPPGGIVDIVVPMRAPGTAGVYTGYWGLYTNPNVLLFGKVWVTINVDVDAAGPTPTATNPPPVNCGDGVIDLGEVCDDGLLNSDTVPDACRTDCTPADCGDGVIDLGEVCDDGNGVDTDVCTNACTVATCGDGVVQAGVEACDDGLLNSDTVPDACRTDCTPADCGDGVIDLGEVCDDGLLNSDTVPGACHTDCMSYDFWVTDVSLTVGPLVTVVVPCEIPTDVTFVIDADITTSAAGTVTYRWKKCVETMCQEFPFIDLVYTEASTKTVTLTWEFVGMTIGVGEDKNLGAHIYILSPNNEYFPGIDFYIIHDTCLS